MEIPKLNLTPVALLDLPLHGNSTLRDVIASHAYEGQFGVNVDYMGMEDSERNAFQEAIAKKLINTVLRDVVQAATSCFGGDACDFGEWVNDQIKE